jgi:hypothetical protein
MKICSRCKTEKPLSDFVKDAHKRSGIKSSCRICYRLDRHRRSHGDKALSRIKVLDKLKEKKNQCPPNMKWCNPGQHYVLLCGFDAHIRSRDGLRSHCKGCGKAERDKNKKIVIAHYSDGSNSCKCCGETAIEFLTVDHIEGGGSSHRKQIGTGIIHYLLLNNLPQGYQILCFNCNCAKGFFGYCPHEKS